MEIKVKRVYEPIDEPADGMRVLVDRLWPRGMKKATLKLDDWAKALAPSTEARKAFGHKAENFASFKSRYLAELNQSPDSAAYVAKLKQENPPVLTLLYAARDPKVNHAVILREWLDEQINGAA